ANQSSGWSTEAGRTVDRAHDDNALTEAWADTEDPVWLEYDLGAAYTLDYARVYDDNSGNHLIGQWKVQYYDNGEWIDAFEYLTSETEGWSEASLAGITTDRVRVLCQAPAGLLMELREFECYAVPASPSEDMTPPELTLTSITINGTVTDLGNGIDTLSVNGTPATVNQDGTWQSEINITGTPHVTTLTATDMDGNQTSRSIIIE
ncbi:MAG: discoidin domain-containing protein, partial [Planctomycetes bacterium]|nr:discoidin domain-containing protein [Planctomycetota bacterium]